MDIFSTPFEQSAFQKAPGIRDVSTFNFREPTDYVQFRKYWGDLGVQLPDVGANGLLRLSTASNIYSDTDIVTQQGDEVGNVANIIVNLDQGQVTFLIVSSGGVLGVNTKYTVIPWAMIKLPPFQRPNNFIIQADMQKLKAAPGFNSLNAINSFGPNWEQQYYSYWNVSPLPLPTLPASTPSGAVGLGTLPPGSTPAPITPSPVFGTATLSAASPPAGTPTPTPGS